MQAGIADDEGWDTPPLPLAPVGRDASGRPPPTSREAHRPRNRPQTTATTTEGPYGPESTRDSAPLWRKHRPQTGSKRRRDTRDYTESDGGSDVDFEAGDEGSDTSSDESRPSSKRKAKFVLPKAARNARTSTKHFPRMSDRLEKGFVATTKQCKRCEEAEIHCTYGTGVDLLGRPRGPGQSRCDYCRAIKGSCSTYVVARPSGSTRPQRPETGKERRRDRRGRFSLPEREAPTLSSNGTTAVEVSSAAIEAREPSTSAEASAQAETTDADASRDTGNETGRETIKEKRNLHKTGKEASKEADENGVPSIRQSCERLLVLAEKIKKRKHRRQILDIIVDIRRAAG